MHPRGSTLSAVVEDVAASESVAGAAGGAAYPGHLLATPPSADPPLLLPVAPEELPLLLPPVLPLEPPLLLVPLLVPDPLPPPLLLLPLLDGPPLLYALPLLDVLPLLDALPLPSLPPVPELELQAAATAGATHVMRSITTLRIQDSSLRIWALGCAGLCSVASPLAWLIKVARRSASGGHGAPPLSRWSQAVMRRLVDRLRDGRSRDRGVRRR
jgi:hypothetical protein